MPPFVYYGGKALLAQEIAQRLPEHAQYVEPFAGSMSVLLAKAPSRLEVVNDLDGDVMAFWRVLRDRPEDLVRVCALTPHSRAERDAALHRDDSLGELERARRVWVCLSQGRTGTLRTTGWRFTADDSASTSMPRMLAHYVERMRAVAARLLSVSLECRPALEVIAAYGRYRNTLLYCDPPYLAQTRSKGGAHNYRHEMSRRDQHEELAAALTACRATVVLSGYPSSVYEQWYQGWYRCELRAATSQGGQHVGRTEVLWSNRPLREAGFVDEPLPLDFGPPPLAADEGAPVARCAECGLPMAVKPVGRPRTTCSDACRKALGRRRRQADRYGDSSVPEGSMNVTKQRGVGKAS